MTALNSPEMLKGLIWYTHTHTHVSAAGQKMPLGSI